MHLWLIVLLSGQIAMTVGPLPYDEAECHRRAKDKLQEINSDAAKSKIAEENHLAVRCVWQSARPTLGDRP